jgi:DNA-binding beta-propeller fold protein YncE
MKRTKLVSVSISFLVCLAAFQFFSIYALAEEKVSVKKIDFLEVLDMDINAAGPLLLQMDEERNRLAVANTLTSSITIIDCESHSIENISLEGRVLQHLKSEAMTIRRKTGDVYLVGTKALFIISPAKRSAITIPTNVQYESVVVNEETGNVFLTGRESESLGFIKAGSKKLDMVKWLDSREDLINLNQTPPPPIRKVVSDNVLNQIIAVDGFTSTLYTFDARTGKQISSRAIKLTSGGRWHLAGYNQKKHWLFLVAETSKRKVIEAVKIEVSSGEDTVVPLPEFSEGVGIIYNEKRNEVYIPYDNHPSIHVVNFNNGCTVDEIKIPAYGNDGSALDAENDILYIASWAFGEVDVIDLEARRLKKRITGLGIIPHMFTFALNPNNSLVYFPKGATAVNGTFGTAISALDPGTEKVEKIYAGWAPIDLIELPERDSFLVFNSEDQFAEVRADGSFDLHTLPYDYPIRAIYSPENDIYLSYGPHQSYWPTVYIWDAKNGILTIDKDDLSFYDRRIPRQAHEIVLDKNGVAYFTQNNWGKEEQFLGTLGDEVRVFEASKRMTLEDQVQREITQRILKYDSLMHRLYLVRVGEKDEDPSLLQVIDPEDQRVLHKLALERTATDLVFDDKYLYISNFDSNSVSIINKKSFEIIEIETQGKPLKLCQLDGQTYVINHRSNSLQTLRGMEEGKIYEIPYEGLPDGLFTWKNKVIVTSHSSKALYVIQFDPKTESFVSLHKEVYPYGDTSYDSRNVSFYVRGQYGDAVFSLNQGRIDKNNRLWITDFLSGKMFILGSN